MDAHLNVIGFLLTAIVFSVGFFSARLHASAEASLAHASEASWRLRQELAAGTPVAPQELASVLATTTTEFDRVATLTRLLNIAMATGCFVLALDASHIYVGVEPTPHRGLLLLWVLLASALAITALGEYDARNVTRRTERSIGNTTLGRLDRLAAALTSTDHAEARRLLDLLSPACSGWILLDEIEALILLQEGQPGEALSVLERSVSTAIPEVFLGPTITTAAAMLADELIRGIELLDIQIQLAPSQAGAERLRFGLGLLAGHLDELVGEQARARPRHESGDARRELLTELLGEATETKTAAPQTYLDFGPHTMTTTRELLVLVDAWTAADRTPAEIRSLVPPRGSLHLMMAAIDGDVATPEVPSSGQAALDRLAELSRTHSDPRTVETAGMLLLLHQRPRHAVRALERAVSMRPSMARLHWDLSMAYLAVGWFDTAVEAAARAVALDPLETLFRSTSRHFTSGAKVDTRSVPTGCDDDLAQLQWMILSGASDVPRPIQHSPVAASMLRLARERVNAA